MIGSKFPSAQVRLTVSQNMNLLRLCIFIFVLMFAIGMATPIVPLYASSLGASWIDIGLLGTSWGITLMLLAFVSGRLSDRYGRKPLLIASGALSVVGAFLYLASSTVLQVILIRIVEGVAWALFWPTVEALATEIVEPTAAGRAMGIATATYGMAFASSSLVGGYITSLLGFSGTFDAYLLLALASTLAAILLLKGADRRHIIRLNRTDDALNSSSLRSPIILLAYFLGGAYTFGFGIIITLFSVYSNALGVTVFLIGLLFGCFWVGRIVGSVGGGHLSDKLGRESIVTIAMTGSTVGFLMVAFSTGIALLFVGIIVLGLSVGATFPVAVALISDNVNQCERGFSMGMFETTCAAGFILAATFGGILSDLYSPRMPYLLAGTVALAPAIIFALKRVRAERQGI